MERKEYNGWTNYETWCAALWIDNDGMGEIFRERMQELTEVEDMDTDERKENLAEYIKEMIEENNPVQDASMYSDLLTTALQEIDWYEIAEHYFEE